MTGVIVEVICERCGFKWLVNSTRKPNSLCSSCRAKRVQTVQNKEGKCYPWHGHFAADMVTPIAEDGEPILPGVRLCGNLDCVNPSHVKEGKNGIC